METSLILSPAPLRAFRVSDNYDELKPLQNIRAFRSITWRTGTKDFIVQSRKIRRYVENCYSVALMNQKKNKLLEHQWQAIPEKWNQSVKCVKCSFALWRRDCCLVIWSPSAPWESKSLSSWSSTHRKPFLYGLSTPTLGSCWPAFPMRSTLNFKFNSSLRTLMF